MNANIAGLRPEAIWRNFAKLLSIPRPSKHEGRIIAFMKEFGENLGLETIVDPVGNVIIRKPATPGMENRQGIILQGHLDMVPQKNSDVSHDFLNDPIDAWIDGEWVKARGTTLGADNGMGVAAAMAILESTDIPHGPVEALFTIDEETGMTGAFNLQPGVLKGDILMNMDSEDEGELYIGCAGGMNATMSFSYSEENVPAGHSAFRLSVTGMKGGHSGMDINLGRGNAIKSLVRFLWENQESLGLRLASVDGGGLRNAIPREAFCIITLPTEKLAALNSNFAAFSATIKSELSSTEPEMRTGIEAAEMPSSVMDKKTQENMLSAVYACPNGVIRMSPEMEGLVETSTNLAILKSDDGKVRVMCLLRSSVDSAKEDLAHMIESVFSLAGAECLFDGAYPGWKPNPDSLILHHMKDIYNVKYGRVPEVKAIHAGLECGILGAVYPHWDMISFGPTIRFPHSPDEKVNIPSVEKFWDYLVETLKQIPSKPMA
jgi:dipeptidase D